MAWTPYPKERRNWISTVERTHQKFHCKHVVIHSLAMGFWSASFDAIEQLDAFAKTVGFTYTLRMREENHTEFGVYEEYDMSHKILESQRGFWKLDELPEGVKPIKALSNGHLVTCYFRNDGETIRFYRPNPNAAEVYDPMPLRQHIEHQKIYGTY